MKNWIVVVDDEALSLTSVRTLLAAEDLKISCLPSGKALLKFMENNNPDLILLDVMMPEIDGFETFAALRKQEKAQNKPDIPVIFLTGESDEETERYGLKLGAADYIHKPFNKDILISRIRNTINNSKRIESLTEDATKDKLTGFFNKAEGVERVRDALASFSGALLMLDLDNFKLVNDLYGHEKGDEILKEFALLARNSAGSADILCRIGGDEFLFLCCDLHEEKALSEFTGRLNKRFDERSRVVLGADHSIPLGISVGAVSVPKYGTDYDLLFKMADEAMYRTKQNGKHGCTLYVVSDLSCDPVKNPEDELLKITKIIEERNQGKEALILGTDAFSTLFRFVDRFNNNYGGKSLVLLFIVSADKGMDGNIINDALVSFEKVLRSSLEKSDIIMHSNNNQFYVLLPSINGRDSESVINKIMTGWKDVPGSSDFLISTASQIR
ncbi:MAG: diguanylate cyclase [Lachnospiraceae bacterium]|nr:diguanylate cyclase [Lachnospiraceae bacterium]